MHVKDCHAKVKAAGEADGLEEGQYRALVSVFGKEDRVGDVVMRGAFTQTLKTWQEKGDPIPIVWAHDWTDPYSHIGHVVKAEETDDGLVVTGQLDLENQKAQQVYRLLKGRRVTQHSFAYDIADGALAERDGRDIYELRKVDLHEVGPCLIGAQAETQLLAAKAHGLAGSARRGVKTDVETLRAAYDALGEVLAEAEKAEGPDDDTDPDEPDEEGSADSEETTGQDTEDDAADHDPSGGKSASPAVTPAQVLASITIQRLTGGTHAHAG